MACQITGVSNVYWTVQSISKKTPKLRVTGLCEGNSPVTGEFATQRTSNAQNDSIWWRHHDQVMFFSPTRYPPGSHIKGNKQIRPAWGPAGFYIKVHAPTWGPRGFCWPKMGPTFAAWTLPCGLSAYSYSLIFLIGRFLVGWCGLRHVSGHISFLSQPWPKLCLHFGLGRRSQQYIKPNIQRML